MKKNPTKGLILKLDNIFSKYIRLRDAKSNGDVKCFTCGGTWNWTEMDCGHYITRACKSTRWDEQNCQPQCRAENRYHEGVKDIFALKLQEKYGKDILFNLNIRKNTVFKPTPEWLKLKIDYYKEKVKKLGG